MVPGRSTLRSFTDETAVHPQRSTLLLSLLLLLSSSSSSTSSQTDNQNLLLQPLLIYNRLSVNRNGNEYRPVDYHMRLEPASA